MPLCRSKYFASIPINQGLAAAEDDEPGPPKVVSLGNKAVDDLPFELLSSRPGIGIAAVTAKVTGLGRTDEQNLRGGGSESRDEATLGAIIALVDDRVPIKTLRNLSRLFRESRFSIRARSTVRMIAIPISCRSRIAPGGFRPDRICFSVSARIFFSQPSASRLLSGPSRLRKVRPS